MHRNDAQERRVSKHPGSKSRRSKLGRKQRRRDLRVRQREVRYAKLITLNEQIGVITDEDRRSTEGPASATAG